VSLVSYPVAILAGGLGTRLKPYTEAIPKALVDINGEPFVAHQLRLLAARGVSDVLICVGYLGAMIEKVVGDGSAYGLSTRFHYDGERLLGTAGAIRQALPLLGESFFVQYGDSYLDCDYASIQEEHRRSGKKALMTVYCNENLYDKSNVEFRGGRILAYDKKAQRESLRHIDYGLGAFSRSAFDMVPAGAPFDLAAVYRNLLDQGELAGFEVPERFHEVGSHAGLEEFRTYVAQRSQLGGPSI
jgi:NDP-sugar pyrophosphorylase family protein